MNPLKLPPTGITDRTHYMEMINIDMVSTFSSKGSDPDVPTALRS
jgi:hypothetical protein